MTTKRLLGIGALLTLGIGVYLAVFGLAPSAPVPQTCPTDIRVCPDGSSVVRTGPSCDFALCPAATSTPTRPSAPPGSTTPPETATTFHAGIGQTVTTGNISLTPLDILSDSRCPIDVQCVWAGTVTLKVRVKTSSGTSEMTLELGKAATISSGEITLMEVAPAKLSKIEIPASAYKFTFEIQRQ